MRGFAEEIGFEPGSDWEAFLAAVPAKWAVYLLQDGEGRPFQLLSVKNLRASLGNRLCEQPTDEKVRTIPYRQVVRRVAWQRVDSAAEAEWVYAQRCRELFPDAYRKLMAAWQLWYVSVEPEARFPRYAVTDRVEMRLAKSTFGPIATKAAAQKLVELVEDTFDLCRYHHILVQAPNGQACAYKQMHKCPAPCDGSISMGMYHLQIDQSVAAFGNAEYAAPHVLRMRQSASAMEYELAGKIKAYVDALTALAEVRPVAAWPMWALLRGGSAKAFKLMRVQPGAVELSGPWQTVPEAKAWAAGLPPAGAWDEERLTFTARQMLLQRGDGIWLASLDEIEGAMARLRRHKVEKQSADEGVEQEAQ